ncbi:hypothetical protein D3C78_1491430 [compost metagenome]
MMPTSPSSTVWVVRVWLAFWVMVVVVLLMMSSVILMTEERLCMARTEGLASTLALSWEIRASRAMRRLAAWLVALSKVNRPLSGLRSSKSPENCLEPRP